MPLHAGDHLPAHFVDGLGDIPFGIIRPVNLVVERAGAADRLPRCAGSTSDVAMGLWIGFHSRDAFVVLVQEAALIGGLFLRPRKAVGLGRQWTAQGKDREGDERAFHGDVFLSVAEPGPESPANSGAGSLVGREQARPGPVTSSLC